MKMKRMMASVLSSLILMSMMTGCSGNSPSTSAAASTAAPSATASDGADNTTTYTWKCALNSTEGDNAYDAAVIFKEKIAELTDGSVQVDLYGGASLGSTREVLEGMKVGVADIICESVGTLAPFTPLANIDAMPYMYSGYDHFMNVWSSELGEEMKTTIGEAAGFKLLGGAYRGARIVTATKRMENPEDFKGFKLRAPNLDVYVKTWKWLNASPTPMAMNEVYTALQQGTVEGQENPMVDDLNYSFDEVCHYWIKTNHVYSCNLFMMDLAYFNGLPEDIKMAVNEAASYAGQQISEQQSEKDAAAEETLLSKGLEVIEVDLNAFSAKFEGFAQENYPDLADWVTRIQAMNSNN